MPVDLTHPDRPRGQPEMSGEEMKALRRALGLSTIQLGRAFGYQGTDNTVSVTIRKYESDMRTIPPWLARLLIMFRQHGVPPSFLASPDTRPVSPEEVEALAARFSEQLDKDEKEAGE